MPNKPVRASGEAMPETHDPLFPTVEPAAIAIKMAVLRKMGMKELNDFRTVMHTIDEVLCGILCQPRFGSDDESDPLNGAGELISNLHEFICVYEQAAINVLRAAQPASSHDIEEQALGLINWHADMGDGLPEIAVLATKAVVDSAVAREGGAL